MSLWGSMHLFIYSEDMNLITGLPGTILMEKKDRCEHAIAGVVEGPASTCSSSQLPDPKNAL